MRIQGTTAKGGINEVQVTKSGQISVFAVVEDELENVSANEGEAYNWTSGIIDIDDGDTVLLLKNDSATNLHIESITINCGSTASQFRIHLPTSEVTPTGVTVTGTKLNTARSGAADVTAKSDETDNSQGEVVFTPMLAVDSNKTINTRGLILGKNKSVAIDVVTAGTEVGATIRAFYA